MQWNEVLMLLVTSLFAVAFAAWAKRLDKALDLLEKLQVEMHKSALHIERRVTRLEAHAGIFTEEEG